MIIRKILGGLLLVVAISFTAQAQPVMGSAAPDINMPDVNGSVINLSDYKGKLVLIDFWASWCVPCRKSNKDLVSLYSKYKAKGFEIYGISLDKDKSAWKKAIDTDKIRWVQVNEPGGWDAPVALKWNIEALPSSYLLDKEGKIIAINPSKQQLEAELKKLK